VVFFSLLLDPFDYFLMTGLSTFLVQPLTSLRSLLLLGPATTAVTKIHGQLSGTGSR
jgi:hypothetical protein